MNLWTMLSETNARFPHRVILQYRPRYRTQSWTTADVVHAAEQISRSLDEMGVKPGDRVMIFAPTAPIWVAAFFGIMHRGAIAVPLNIRSTPEQIAQIMASAKPTALVKSIFLPWMSDEIATIDVETTMRQQRPALLPVDTSAKDLAVIMYTSGTTGEPKGVMLTHQNLLANVEAISKVLPLSETDHFVSIIPFFHMYGLMCCALYPLKYGAAVTHMPSLGTKTILETFAETPATHLAAVPEFLKTLMDRFEQRLDEKHLGWVLRSSVLRILPMSWRRVVMAPLRKKISATLHTISSGGAPLDPETELRWRALGITVLQGYGLTETSPIISTNTYDHWKTGTVGRVLPGEQVKVSADGELFVKGPNVMQGYYERPDLTKAVLSRGWFRTGDGASIDRDGFIRIFGRKKYTIVLPGGEKIFPEDVEKVLNKQPGIRECAVVGIPEKGRTVIHAVCLTKEAVDLDKVTHEANRHLASHQQIMAWSRWPDEDFPRTAIRKIKKELIIDWLTKRDASSASSTAASATSVSPLMRIVGRVLHEPPEKLSPTTRLVKDLKLDSLLRIELVSQIEEELGVTIEEATIDTKTTMADLDRLLLTQKGKAPAITKYPRWSERPWARAVRPMLQDLFFDVYLRRQIDLTVVGWENIRQINGPVMFMPNHRSYIDPAIILMALPRSIRHRLGIAAASNVLYEKFRHVAPLADLFFNSFPLATEASQNSKPGLEYAGKLLDHGSHMLIFPEGQVNRTKKAMNHLKSGTGVLATEMRVPIIPIAIVGIEKMLKPGELFPKRRGKVTVAFGEPMSFRETMPITEATEEIEKAIAQLIEEAKRRD